MRKKRYRPEEIITKLREAGLDNAQHISDFVQQVDNG